MNQRMSCGTRNLAKAEVLQDQEAVNGKRQRYNLLLQSVFISSSSSARRRGGSEGGRGVASGHGGGGGTSGREGSHGPWDGGLLLKPTAKPAPRRRGRGGGGERGRGGIEQDTVAGHERRFMPRPLTSPEPNSETPEISRSSNG